MGNSIKHSQLYSQLDSNAVTSVSQSAFVNGPANNLIKKIVLIALSFITQWKTHFGLYIGPGGTGTVVKMAETRFNSCPGQDGTKRPARLWG